MQSKQLKRTFLGFKKELFLAIFAVTGIVNAETTDFFQKSNEASLWKTKHGYNLKTEIKSNTSGPDGKACTEFKIEYKDPSNRIADARWFQIIKPITEKTLWKNAESFAFEICGNRKQGWSLSFALVEEDGTVFRVPGRPRESPPLEYVKCRYQFSDLVSIQDKKRKFNPEKISAFRLDGGAPIGSLYLRNLEISAKQVPGTRPFLQAKLLNCDNLSNTLWNGCETVLSLKGTAPEGIKTVTCVISDYFGKTILKKSFPADSREILLKPGSLPGGYYELRVFPADKNGREEKDSCIVTGGTQIPGLFTFAVAAEKKEDIIKDIRRYGMDSFYGIQNPHYRYDTALTTGAPWEINMPRWSWHEPQNPQIRNNEEPEWLKKAFSQGKRSEHLYAVCSFVHHFSQVPKWAQVPRTEENKLGIANFRNFIDYIGNCVRLNVFRYPHMNQRPYELTWEPDLSGPSYSKHPPYWTAKDTVDFYKMLAPVIRKKDSRAQILGPKSTLNLDYLEETLKLGLGKYIDAISMHFYSTPVPEEGNLPRNIARIREMSRKYIGKEVDIYNTEGGYHSRINGINDLKGQA